ncbi:MAG: GGDEF domain-containing protein [Solirubrobacterales bacterium]|nr:GGDEF domain-containing protein [Solirubrobacterales bacterium]
MRPQRGAATAAARTAPFAAACCLAWIAVLVGSSVTWWEYWLSLGLAMTAGSVAFGAIITRRHVWLAVVPSSLLILAAAGLLRDAGGGIPSGAGALAILPVFQTALYSRSRRDLGIVLAAVALFFLVPIWVVGAPGYPTSQYRTVLLAVSVDAIIGLTTQRLVGRSRHEAGEARLREQMLEQVSEVVHGLFDSPQPRSDACEAVMRIGSARSALLFEPREPTNELVCTAAAGIELDGRELVVERRSAAYQSLDSRQPILNTENVQARIGLIELWIAAGRPSSVLYQPLLRGDAVLGVLAVSWPDHVRAEGPRATVVSLLAHEVAAVISRADAITHLSDEALTDALTGLPNRRAWEQRLTELSAAKGNAAVAILDLDHFKQFNDAHGHPAGDRLLKHTAAVWRDQLRTGDFLGRIGGEEFGLLLPDCDRSVAHAVVDRLRGAMTSGTTCSAGIAVQRPPESPEALVLRADQALYQAKAEGRDRVRLTEAGVTGASRAH